MNAHHAIVWIDHTEARIFRFVGEGVEHVSLHAKKPHLSNRREQVTDPHYFDEVITALRDAERILVVGPSKAKLELLRHMRKVAHDTEEKVVGIETVDHPTDGQLVDHARRYFHASDRMTG